MAQKARIAAFWYPNPQETGNPFRPMDMSAITGTMYRGTVNLKLHTQGYSILPFMSTATFTAACAPWDTAGFFTKGQRREALKIYGFYPETEKF